MKTVDKSYLRCYNCYGYVTLSDRILMAKKRECIIIEYPLCTNSCLDFTEEQFKNDKELGQRIFFTYLKFALEHGVYIPMEYVKLPVSYISNEDESKFGYIIEFHDAISECDCSFVGMIYENGKRKYYTAEYYEFTKTYGFCS